MHNSKNQYIAILYGINDYILADSKSARAGAKFVAQASHVGMTAKQEKLIGDGINHTVGDIHAATLTGQVQPDIVKIGICSGRPIVGHQRAKDRLASKRARPRCFTSSASC